MKKTKVPASNIQVTKSSGNVFIDLGFDAAEADTLSKRVELMLEIERHITAEGWTQAEAARRMGITQPRVSKIKKRKWDEFSLDMLLTLAERIGLHHELKRAA